MFLGHLALGNPSVCVSCHNIMHNYIMITYYYCLFYIMNYILLIIIFFTTASGLIYVAEIVSAAKRALSRVLIIIVCEGFGTVK